MEVLTPRFLERTIWIGPFVEALVAETVLSAGKSLACLLFVTGSLLIDVNNSLSPKMTSRDGRFPLEDLYRGKHAYLENKNASETEDDEDDENDEDANDDDEDGEDEEYSGEEGEEGGDSEDDHEANGAGGSDDENSDNDDDNDDNEEDEDEDEEEKEEEEDEDEEEEEEEEEALQPPTKKRK